METTDMNTTDTKTTDTNTTPMWLVTGFRTVDEAAAREVETVLRSASVAVEGEPGINTYVVCADLDDPSFIWVLEEWANTEDARRHEERVAAQGAADSLAHLLSAPPETAHLSLLIAATFTAGTLRNDISQDGER